MNLWGTLVMLTLERLVLSINCELGPGKGLGSFSRDVETATPVA